MQQTLLWCSSHCACIAHAHATKQQSQARKIGKCPRGRVLQAQASMQYAHRGGAKMLAFHGWPPCAGVTGASHVFDSACARGHDRRPRAQALAPPFISRRSHSINDRKVAASHRRSPRGASISRPAYATARGAARPSGRSARGDPALGPRRCAYWSIADRQACEKRETSCGKWRERGRGSASYREELAERGLPGCRGPVLAGGRVPSSVAAAACRLTTRRGAPAWGVGQGNAVDRAQLQKS